MADERTPGWPVHMDSVVGLTADQHAALAEDLLDAQCVASVSEDAWNGSPPHRHYTDGGDDSVDPDGTRAPADYGPFLAAITHALLAVAKATPTQSPPSGRATASERRET